MRFWVVYIGNGDYELYQEINFTMVSIPSILGGMLEMHYMYYMYNLDLKVICTARIIMGAPSLRNGKSVTMKAFRMGGVLDFKKYYFRVRKKKWEFYTSTYTIWVKIFEKGPNLQLVVNNIN